jgi:NitT/TauT family transport system substrate-binding protein
MILLLLLSGVSGVFAQELDPVRLQLQWVAQSQFAGYFAALDLGIYEEYGLDVTILEGAPEIFPQVVVPAGGAEFGIAWVPKVLEANASEGVNLVNIAQVFQRSGTLEVAFVDSGIETVEDFAGQTIGSWLGGNEHELFAAMRLAGLDPDAEDIQQQGFSMAELLDGSFDAAQAMIYNEYAQVLEAVNPDTGELYQPEDLNVIDFNEVGTAMLQDHIFVNADWLAEEGNEDIATRFIAASMQGWIHCRDNFDECVEIVLDNGTTLGESHMRWQLNEINGLIWPSPNGVGVMDPALFEQTVNIAVEGGVLAAAPGEGAYRTDLAEAAIALLTEMNPDLDTTGEMWERIDVELLPGGE